MTIQLKFGGFDTCKRIGNRQVPTVILNNTYLNRTNVFLFHNMNTLR